MIRREMRFIVAILVLENVWVCYSAAELPQSRDLQTYQLGENISKEKSNVKSFMKNSAKLGYRNSNGTEKVPPTTQDPNSESELLRSFAFESKLGQFEDEKASMKQVIDQFEEFKKASRQRALDYIKSLEEKTLKPNEYLPPDSKSPSKSGISAFENRENLSINSNHNKIDSRKPGLNPEFTQIEELTIYTSGDGIEPAKLNSLNSVKQFDSDLQRPLLKRGVDDSWKKGPLKITKGHNGSKRASEIYKSRKIPQIKHGKENSDVKNSIFKTNGFPSLGFGKFPQDKKMPLLKRHTEEPEKNRIPKVTRASNKESSGVKLTGKFDEQKTGDDHHSRHTLSDVRKSLIEPVLKNKDTHRDGNILSDVRFPVPLLKPVLKNDDTDQSGHIISNVQIPLPVLKNEIPKMSKNETVKAGFNRKITPLNIVYHLDAECVAFPSERTRAKFLERGQFVPKNLMINRIQFSGDKAYVTMPKLKRGVPFSVGKVALAGGPKGNLRIEAFPNWAIHRYANVSGIVNAVDIFAEEGTLWILDSGVVWTLENPERLAPPKVFAVDLMKEEVIKAIDLSNFVDKTSRLQHIVVETGPYNCRFVYISDAASRSLIIWDVCNDFGSKIVLPKSIQPEVAAQPDILYLNLVARGKTDLLAVTFLSADNLFGIPTYSLQNLKFGTMTGDVTNLGLKLGKVVVLGADRKWVYFRFVASGDIYAWDAATDLKEENLKKLRTGNGDEFATQVTMGYKRLVWALESNFQDYGKQRDESGLVFSIRAICKSSDLPIV